MSAREAMARETVPEEPDLPRFRDERQHCGVPRFPGPLEPEAILWHCSAGDDRVSRDRFRGRHLTEILTESFCERCGTRYTFESAAPRRARLRKVRTIGKGMKNFVLSDDASFSEAMAEARSEQELTAVNHQLDAFHQTFNFCLTCRQYTCGDCWNDADGRCLTCAPIPGLEEPMRAAALADAPAMESIPEAREDEAWPDADLSSARLSRVLGLDEAELQATAEAGRDDDLNVDAALAAAAALSAAPIHAHDADAVSAAADAVAPDATENAGAEVAAQEPLEVEPTVAGVAPGQSLEDAIAEYE